MWVCDPPQRKITRFNPDGGAQTVAPQSAVDRIDAVGDTLITMAPPGGNALFEIYDLSGKRLRSFGVFLEDQPNQGCTN